MKEELRWICNMCGMDAGPPHGTRYSCWPTDQILVTKTSEDRETLQKRGYTPEMAHFRVEWVRFRESLGALERRRDDLGKIYWAAIKSRENK